MTWESLYFLPEPHPLFGWDEWITSKKPLSGGLNPEATKDFVGLSRDQTYPHKIGADHISEKALPKTTQSEAVLFTWNERIKEI